MPTSIARCWLSRPSSTSQFGSLLPAGRAPHLHLFLNRNLAGLQRLSLKGEAVIAAPLKLTRPADERRDFMAALMGAISLRSSAPRS